MHVPTLIVICGPPGAGKTTIAQGLGLRLGCPTVCRDAIKEGMILTTGHTLTEVEHQRLDQTVLAAFGDVLAVLVRAGASVVAEAAFQDRVWRLAVGSLLDTARVLMIRCRVDPATARARLATRAETDPRRAVHQDDRYLAGWPPPDFGWPTMDGPALDLDTEPTADAAANVETAAAFVLSGGGQNR